MKTTPLIEWLQIHCEFIVYCKFLLATCLFNGYLTNTSYNALDQHSEIYPNHHGYVVAGPVFLLQPEQFKELDITRNKVGLGAENDYKNWSEC